MYMYVAYMQGKIMLKYYFAMHNHVLTIPLIHMQCTTCLDSVSCLEYEGSF